MARTRRDYDRGQFATRIREIVAEKGTAETAKRFGKSADTIRQWANGTRAPAARDTIIDKVNRSYNAQKSRWNDVQHAEKLREKYGAEKARSGSILEYMKVLDTAHNLSRPAKQTLLNFFAEGYVVNWNGSKAMPVSNVRLTQPFAPTEKPPTGGALSISLTAKYETGEKGKRKETVQGIVTQKINRAVYRTTGDRTFPEKQTPAQFHAETARIALNTKVTNQKQAAVYLGYADLD